MYEGVYYENHMKTIHQDTKSKLIPLQEQINKLKDTEKRELKSLNDIRKMIKSSLTETKSTIDNK